MRRLRQVKDPRAFKFLLKEAGMYLQFLNEDVELVESIRENMASQIEQLLKGATEKLRESVNLLNLELREGKQKIGDGGQ